jgi:hypothetical protein
MPRLRTISFWIVAVLLAHVAGSYGFEVGDMIDHYGQSTPVAERLKAPVEDLWPLILATHSWGFTNQKVRFYWSFYLGPAAITLVLAPYLVHLRRRRLQTLTRGFDVLPRESGSG